MSHPERGRAEALSASHAHDQQGDDEDQGQATPQGDCPDPPGGLPGQALPRAPVLRQVSSQSQQLGPPHCALLLLLLLLLLGHSGGFGLLRSIRFLCSHCLRICAGPPRISPSSMKHSVTLSALYIEYSKAVQLVAAAEGTAGPVGWWIRYGGQERLAHLSQSAALGSGAPRWPPCPACTHTHFARATEDFRASPLSAATTPCTRRPDLALRRLHMACCGTAVLRMLTPSTRLFFSYAMQRHAT